MPRSVLEVFLECFCFRVVGEPNGYNAFPWSVFSGVWTLSGVVFGKALVQV